MPIPQEADTVGDAFASPTLGMAGVHPKTDMPLQRFGCHAWQLEDVRFWDLADFGRDGGGKALAFSRVWELAPGSYGRQRGIRAVKLQIKTVAYPRLEHGEFVYP